MRWRTRVAIALVVLTAVARPVAAHAAALGGTADAPPVPTWLVVFTGGGVVAVSFLFTTLVTDHDLLRGAVDRGRILSTAESLPRGIGHLLRATSVGLLVVILVLAFVGPHESSANLAVLLVWAAWWAGYTVTVYAGANTWPAINPWRGVAGAVGALLDRTADVDLRVGPLPVAGVRLATAGLLALVFVEVVSPVAEQPRLLGTVVVGYSLITIVGALRYRHWFARADPVTAVFRWYGRMAPVGREPTGIGTRLPGAGLVRGEPASGRAVTFVVALLWVTTFDGLVSTPAWAALARPLLDAGVPRLLLYFLALVAGLALFRGAFRLACQVARRTAGTYLTTAAIERWFIPSLIPIAAGYHLAHFLGYAVTFAPAVLATIQSPLAGGAVPTVVLPGWFGVVELLFVVIGHILAVAVAHTLAFERFTGRLQPIRSQYPFVLVMVGYTVTSMWIVAQPYVRPP